MIKFKGPLKDKVGIERFLDQYKDLDKTLKVKVTRLFKIDWKTFTITKKNKNTV